MNPRLFCRERSYHKALLLTYSFDPIFFEQVVLPDLWAGRSSDILVLGDRTEIDTSIQSAVGQLWHLGKQYLLAGADMPGAFHPKVFLRLGPKDGVIMLGSGNVTSSGWGGNQELGTAWMLGPDHADNGGWLHAFLDDVLTWCRGDLERDAVRRFKDVPWLSLTPSEDTDTKPVLLSRHTRPLGTDLARRWVGRRFDEVKILTGSTDESGAFLRWAHETFGVTRATIALTPSSASFVAERLADLPLEVRLIEAPSDRPLHAKFYWFDGADGPAAVMGSANCSAAAWLLAPENNGNIESIIIYDQPDTGDFEAALSLVAGPGQAPSDLLAPRPLRESAPVTDHSPFVLRSVHWDSATRRMYAEIVPTLDRASQVDLLLDGRRFPMARAHEPRALWTCEITERLDAVTVFASVIVMMGSDTWTTAPRWVDDIAALAHASQAARLLEPFKSLDRSTSSAEQRQMLDDLQEVAQVLFHDTASFRDPGFGGNDRKSNSDTPSEPVNPANLIVPLGESHDALTHSDVSRPGSLSLTGILRLLFHAETDEERQPAAAGDEDIDEGQIPDAPPPTKQVDRKDPSDAAGDAQLIEARYRERLATQINTFVKELSSTAFAGRCTATQMVQAVSFPLAVALRGRRQGWVTEELAERWALQVFSILFRSRASGCGGLLGAVEQRYLQNGQKNTFEDVVGDGTLWLVLIATLAGASWHGIGTDIDKAIALREVFNSPPLLASANSARVTGLLGKIRIEDARAYVANVAPAVTRLLEDIECGLKPIWETEMQDQRQRAITHQPGDLLWRDGVGWAVCLEQTPERANQQIKARLKGVEMVVMAGFYVNVSEVCCRNLVLARLIDELRSVAATPIPAAKPTCGLG